MNAQAGYCVAACQKIEVEDIPASILTEKASIALSEEEQNFIMSVIPRDTYTSAKWEYRLSGTVPFGASMTMKKGVLIIIQT